MNKLLLKKIVGYYLNETDDIRLNQLAHRIELLAKQKEQIQSHIDNLKNSIDRRKERKERIADEISKLKFEKQKISLRDRGILP